jgi:hypothetical protein
MASPAIDDDGRRARATNATGAHSRGMQRPEASVAGAWECGGREARGAEWLGEGAACGPVTSDDIERAVGSTSAQERDLYLRRRGVALAAADGEAPRLQETAEAGSGRLAKRRPCRQAPPIEEGQERERIISAFLLLLGNRNQLRPSLWKLSD